MMLSIVHCPKPVIAAVNGVATAAGCQLVATCDLAVASIDARFATPGVNIGLFCSTPMVALSRNVSRKAAMEMLLLGEMVGAEEARRSAWSIAWCRRDRVRRRGGRARRAKIAEKPTRHAQDRQGGLLPPARDAARRGLCLCFARDGREHARTPKPRKASAPSSTSASRAGRAERYTSSIAHRQGVLARSTFFGRFLGNRRCGSSG